MIRAVPSGLKLNCQNRFCIEKKKKHTRFVYSAAVCGCRHENPENVLFLVTATASRSTLECAKPRITDCPV